MARDLYTTFIQHTDSTRKLKNELIKKKAEKKKLKKDNTIQHIIQHVYNTNIKKQRKKISHNKACIQHKKNIRWAFWAQV